MEHPDSSLRHHQFTYHSITDININLKNFNKEIIVFYQEALKVFEYLNETFEIINVYSYQETGILKSWNRDKLVHNFFKKHNISWKEFQNNGVIRGIQNRNEWDKQWYAKMNTKIIKNKDIFLCDSGGQYKYGTTDVTRTICFTKPKPSIKNIYTKVLKGHIAVANTDLKLDNTGIKIDRRARKYLKESKLDYAHGTGHGVGFFLNVHEGPQSISKLNKVKIQEGMILSNEPGYYKKNKFGIRIENLIFVKKENKKTLFENLTMAPIEKELVNFNLLTTLEKNYLFKYHLDIYSKISKYLNFNERKWLASFI